MHYYISGAQMLLGVYLRTWHDAMPCHAGLPFGHSQLPTQSFPVMSGLFGDR